MAEERPRLRYLEVMPCLQDGETSLVLSDPLRISEQMIVVTPEVYMVLALLNGRNSIPDIQAELTRRRGSLVYREEVENLITGLDHIHFLDNENFRRFRDRVVGAYRSQEVREAAHAGSGYPSDPEELNRMLEDFFSDPQGAGQPCEANKPAPRALVVPHIDLRLGGPTFTHAYRRLAEGRRPELFIILGVGHQGLPDFFSFSKKDFRTPFGVTPADRDCLGALDDLLGAEALEEDLAHRTEHSIEFQLLFLQHLYGVDGFRFVPVLTSFSYSDLSESPQARDRVHRVVKGFLEATDRLDCPTCFVASVDLAHIGPRYGDDFRPTEATVREVMAEDLKTLQPVIDGHAEGFLEAIRKEGDRRRVCGFSPIYTVLSLLPGCPGELLAHSFCWMDQLGSFVTFASMAFGAHQEES